MTDVPMDGDEEDRLLVEQLRRSRARRGRAARLMVLLLVVPLGLQALWVMTGVAVRWGLVAVVVPSVVVWIVVRGRRVDPSGGRGDRLLN